MKTIGGTVSLTINGQVWNLRGEVEINPQDKVQRGIVSEGGPQGKVVEPALPKIRGTLTDVGPGDNFDWNLLLSDNEMNVQVSMNNGRIAELEDAHVEGEITHMTKENEVKVEFVGRKLTYNA